MSIGAFNTENVTRHTTIALWVFALTTVGLATYSAICPPEGVIDKSMLEFGCIMAGFAFLAVAREAIKEGLGVKVKHGDTELEIRDTDNNE